MKNLIIASISILLLLQCKNNAFTENENNIVENINDPIIISTNKNDYNNTALFFSGKDLPETAKLYPHSQTKKYIRYKKYINSNWKKFQVENLKKIRSWSNEKLPSNYNKTVFYPFSGPDILHPLYFYPEANDIIMFGLERPGKIPDPVSDKRWKRMQLLNKIPKAINFILRHNFFITTDMAKNINSRTYASISGLILFFLAIDDYTVIDMKNIWIINNGEITNNRPKPYSRKNISGIEIIFKKNNETKLKRLRFFSLDISNRSIRLKNFTLFIKKQPEVTTMIKSASYLMHHNSFSKIRSLILDKSNSILQDDSGIIFKAFSEKIWDISYHGYYHKPLNVFKKRLQRDLRKKVKDNTSGKIPFKYGYGYGYRNIKYHLIHAKRKPAEPDNNGRNITSPPDPRR